MAMSCFSAVVLGSGLVLGCGVVCSFSWIYFGGLDVVLWGVGGDRLSCFFDTCFFDSVLVLVILLVEEEGAVSIARDIGTRGRCRCCCSFVEDGGSGVVGLEMELRLELELRLCFCHRLEPNKTATSNRDVQMAKVLRPCAALRRKRSWEREVVVCCCSCCWWQSKESGNSA